GLRHVAAEHRPVRIAKTLVSLRVLGDVPQLARIDLVEAVSVAGGLADELPDVLELRPRIDERVVVLELHCADARFAEHPLRTAKDSELVTFHVDLEEIDGLDSARRAITVERLHAHGLRALRLGNRAHTMVEGVRDRSFG